MSTVKELRAFAGDGSCDWAGGPIRASLLADAADAIELLGEENGKLRELVRFMHAELLKDVTFVDHDGNELIKPWGRDYMGPFEERMSALGIEVEL